MIARGSRRWRVSGAVSEPRLFVSMRFFIRAPAPPSVRSIHGEEGDRTDGGAGARMKAGTGWLKLRSRVKGEIKLAVASAHFGPDDKFHRSVDRQFVGSHGDTGVFAGISKGLNEQFRRTVDDGGLLREAFG